MTKMDIVKDVAKKHNITQDQMKDILDSVLDSIVSGLNKDGETRITGFGTFKLRHVDAREGHNPKDTSEKIMIAAHNQVAFSAGKQLKADVNNKSAKKKVVKKK